MSLKTNITRVMSILQKAINQAPLDKQPTLANKVQRIIQKYGQLNNQKHQPALLKELQFNLNFIKLSFPHLDYKEPIETSQTVGAQTKPNQINEQTVKEQFIQLENKDKVDQFMKDTEQVLKGVRQEVQFTNWGAGNIDPEDLKRHKELLKRQYFGGQFWKGKQKPSSPTASYLMDMMQNMPQKKHQKIVVKDSKSSAFDHDPDLGWEKVKR